MSRLSTGVVVVLVIVGLALTAPSLSQAANIRPIADFLSTQGTFTFNNNYLFEPPVPNYGGWANFDLTRFALVDYAGIANKWLIDNDGKSLGTICNGTIIERPLPDGRAEVSVSLHTKRALAFVTEINGFPINGTENLLFGCRAPDVLDGKKPALAECFLQLKFINSFPGADIPDLVQWFYGSDTLDPRQQMEFMSFRADASGPLPDGAPGRATVIQTGLLEVAGKTSPNSRVALDAFPAEFIDLMKVGK